jgi:hypothetical protein
MKVNKAVSRLGGERATTPSHSYLGTRWGWVVSSTSRQCFTPGKRIPSTHWIGGWVGRRAGLKWTDVSEVCAASVIKAMYLSTRLHGAISQKTLNFILAAVRTWNLTSFTLTRHFQRAKLDLVADSTDNTTMTVSTTGTWHSELNKYLCRAFDVQLPFVRSNEMFIQVHTESGKTETKMETPRTPLSFKGTALKT